MTIEIVHEDPDVLAIAKPEGIATIPERDLAVASVQKTLEAARNERLFVVHRLDKEVSGLVVFARHAAAHRTLSMAFEAREVDKTYLALTHGALRPDAGVVDRPIAQFGSGRMGVDDARGKPSRTEWRVVRRYHSAFLGGPGGPEAPEGARDALTLVEAHPVTGRRHQLRVHFYAIGHPLVGDPRYGDRAAQRRWPRLMLHALRLRVVLAGRPLVLEAPPPPSFASVLASLRILGESA